MKNIEEKIKKCLDELRPGIVAHGGDVSFEKFENGTLRLKIKGVCRGCAGAYFTFNLGIEKVLKEKIPEIKEVIFE